MFSSFPRQAVLWFQGPDAACLGNPLAGEFLECMSASTEVGTLLVSSFALTDCALWDSCCCALSWDVASMPIVPQD